jgi:hypothetical protein
VATRQELISCFKMPAGLTITGRASSIRKAFVAAIIPVIRPTVEEIADVLDILGTQPSDLRCSYCGDPASEWDHLRPLVTDGKPTGYPSSIRNLVPSCGKCNQSKGKSAWKTWMTGNAPLLPANRNIRDLQTRIERLEAYERWAKCRPLNIETFVDERLWARYYSYQEDILSRMREAQQVANSIAAIVRGRAADSNDYA